MVTLTKDEVIEFQVESNNKLVKKLVPVTLSNDTVSEEFITQAAWTLLKVHGMISHLAPEGICFPDYDECKDLVNDFIFDIQQTRIENPDWTEEQIIDSFTVVDPHGLIG